MADEPKVEEKKVDEAAEKLAAAEAEVAKWKAMSRKHEDQAKGNADAAKKLKDAEDAQKTAEERLNARIAELEAQTAATAARALRAEVAASKGLTAAQAKRLIGSTTEELEADADELLTTFKLADKDGKDAGDGTKPDTGGTSRPKEKLRSGAGSSEGADEDKTAAEIVAAIPRG